MSPRTESAKTTPSLQAKMCLTTSSTSPKGLTWVKKAYIELVQVYRVLCDWTTQLPINVDAAATTGAQAIQLINLAIGSDPLIIVSGDPAIFIWNFSFFIFRIGHQAGKEMVDADHILRQTCGTPLHLSG